MITFTKITLPTPTPSNLLPAGLPAIVNLTEGVAPTVVFQDNQARLRYRVLRARSKDEPTVFSGLSEALGEAYDGGDFSLGPMVDVAAGLDDALGFPDQIQSFAKMAKRRPPIVGIIDAGIAFWNPAFRTGDKTPQCQFASLGALSMDADALQAATVFDQTALTELCTKPEHEIRDTLAAAFPSSVYAPRAGRPLYRPNGLAHGTAMADLVASAAAPGTALHGLELPDTVLRDLTGGQMAVAMDAAVRALAAQAVAASAGTGAVDMVVLMAFGFTGGPEDGSADILARLGATLDTLRTVSGINMRLVLPVGNHRQDQLRARLTAGRCVSWRIQPEDFSANTVELIQPIADQGLDLNAPDGATATLPTDLGLYEIREGGDLIGAIWCSDIGTGRRRTRLSLAPTAAKTAQDARCPFGLWSFGPAQGDVDLWILRDHTGFEADPAAPARASWFTDELYRHHDALGRPALTDPLPATGATGSAVTRKGSASILASTLRTDVVVVTAEVGAGQDAPYASLPSDGCRQPVRQDLARVDGAAAFHDRAPRHPGDGRAVLGNGTGQRFRAGGTSLAAALEAGARSRRAHFDDPV